jgi:alkanesulfonate monooxygenase SsuD/methylene tetrahydromethanopterin reductase-like flavin-dependent oxidoreductase (luciferase family)
MARLGIDSAHQPQQPLKRRNLMVKRLVSAGMAGMMAVALLSAGCSSRDADERAEKAAMRAEDAARRAESAAGRVETAARRAEEAADRATSGSGLRK